MPRRGGHYGKEVQKSRLSEGRGSRDHTLERVSVSVCVYLCVPICVCIGVSVAQGGPQGLYMLGHC